MDCYAINKCYFFLKNTRKHQFVQQQSEKEPSSNHYLKKEAPNHHKSVHTMFGALRMKKLALMKLGIQTEEDVDDITMTRKAEDVALQCGMHSATINIDLKGKGTIKNILALNKDGREWIAEPLGKISAD